MTTEARSFRQDQLELVGLLLRRLLSGMCVRNRGARGKTLIPGISGYIPYIHLYCQLNSLNITTVAPILGHYSATRCSNLDIFKGDLLHLLLPSKVFSTSYKSSVLLTRSRD